MALFDTLGPAQRNSQHVAQFRALVALQGQYALLATWRRAEVVAMASAEHLAQFANGVALWNAWVAVQRLTRGAVATRHPGARIGVGGFWADLSGANLDNRDFYQGTPGAGWSGIDLVGVDLSGSTLRRSNLAWANLTAATLAGADLTGASLMNARLEGANLTNCILVDALFGGANLLHANARNANFANTYFYETMFCDTDLTDARGLLNSRVAGPCTLDHRTLVNFGPIPDGFLRASGIPDLLIESLANLRANPARYASCFISYATADEPFVRQLYQRLQLTGVRCWFAAEDLPVGAKTWDFITKAVAQHDRLLIVLSKSALMSEWVEDEVTKAFAVERERGTVVVLPVRLDDAVMTTDEAWAQKLRNSRNIGDFRNWKDSSAFDGAFRRLLSALEEHPGSS